jgi:hypothetical protein
MRVHRTSRPTPGQAVPLVAVVGAASRDLAAGDPRGWRLGGAVTYGSLTLARLGLRVRAIVGLDAAAATAHELDLLAASGAIVERVQLERGPVFENVETPAGRRQRCHSTASALPLTTTSRVEPAPDAILFAPVAGELDDAWLALAPPGAIVAVGLQGLLRALRAGADVRRTAPVPSALLRRADLVGLSRDDLPPGSDQAAVVRHTSPTATILVTAADRGGVALVPASGGDRDERRYLAVRSERVVDPTGAGDVFLAAVLAARLDPGLVAGRGGARTARELRFAATAASLAIEAPGILGVPDLASVRRRLTLARSRADRRASAASSRGSGRPSHA